MKAFISYSSLQTDHAKVVKDFLRDIKVDSFVANDDLRSATDWKKSIMEELLECEIFIPLLSKNSKASNWCSQEIGIAYAKKKKIVPISIDATRPYGFIGHLQAKTIDEHQVEILLSEGLLENRIPNGSLGFIEMLKWKGSFRFSEIIFKSMAPFFRRISTEDINKIVELSISNNQVWPAADCRSDYIPKLLSARKSDIDPLSYKKLKFQIDNQKWYDDESQE